MFCFKTYAYPDSAATILSFTNVGSTNWVVPSGVSLVDVLVVGGGGAGGWASGGGGGAGGYIYSTNVSVSNGSVISVVVGIS